MQWQRQQHLQELQRQQQQRQNYPSVLKGEGASITINIPAEVFMPKSRGNGGGLPKTKRRRRRRRKRRRKKRRKPKKKKLPRISEEDDNDKEDDASIPLGGVSGDIRLEVEARRQQRGTSDRMAKIDDSDASCSSEDEICLTTDGPRMGKRCIFPFKIEPNGRTNRECITEKESSGRAWCATKVSESLWMKTTSVTDLFSQVNTTSGVMIEDEWGVCNHFCPMTRKPALLKRRGRRRGMPANRFHIVEVNYVDYP